MKPELDKLCKDYVASREAVHKAFRWDDSALYSVCANIFCACGRTAEAGNLTECRRVIRKNTRPFSGFRNRRIRAILSCMLSLAENPEQRMDTAKEYYRLLRRKFKGTEYLVLTSFLLSDLMDRNLTEELAARGKEIYRRMNRKHRFLTDNTDCVFALLLAYSGRPDDDLDTDMEACFQALKRRFSGNGGAQTASQILSLSSGTAEEKTQRVFDLYDALQDTGVAYGHSAELSPLAALTLADTPVPVLAEEIRDVDGFLEEQKYFESKESGRQQRAMHAVMIVSDQYAGTDQVNVTVMTNTLDMLISKQKLSRLSLAFHLVEFLARLFVSGKEEAKTADTASGQDDGAGNDPVSEKQPAQ